MLQKTVEVDWKLNQAINSILKEQIIWYKEKVQVGDIVLILDLMPLEVPCRL